MDPFVEKTGMLDYDNPRIASLIQSRGWASSNTYEAIGAAYNFVRDEISFGYNSRDDLPASAVLEDGYGQCNTKAVLLMAILRGLGIPCRFHGFTINKRLQKGAVKGFWYAVTPESIIHSWVEVLYRGSWINLEGFILDMPYLQALQTKFQGAERQFCGYGAATADLAKPDVYWKGEDTYIQKDGINRDFGLFDNPDEFFSEHRQNFSPIKRFMFVNLVRKLMNRNVERIRTYARRKEKA